MKTFRIEYIHDCYFPFCAQAHIGPHTLYGHGQTKEQAKERLIAKAKRILLKTLPEPETITLP